MSEQELQQWELRQRDAREKALKTIASAFEDLTMLENWSRRTPAYEVECSCGRRLSVRTKADTAHEALTNELADVRAQLEAAAQPPAPITAEDVRAAERAWGAWSELGDHLEIEDRAAVVADYLNRRGER